MLNFKVKTEEELDKVKQYFQGYPWEQQEAYVDFISNMYYFLAQACRLLASAASRCDQDLDVFYHRFIDHAGEEKNHEKLVINDLKALGAELQPCLYSMPPIWQNQFYLIENKDPLSLFGCILYLENLSLVEEIGPNTYNRCHKEYGKKASTYARVHVEEDEDHIEKLYAMLDQLPEESQQAVMDSMLITSSLYSNFMKELYEKHVTGQTENKFAA